MILPHGLAQDLRSGDFSVRFNYIDNRVEKKYLAEVNALTQRLLDEFATLSGDTGDRKDTMNEDELRNTFFSACQAVPILTFMNRNLQSRNMPLIAFPELEPFMRVFYALCFYNSNVADVKSHPDSYPIVTDAINNLNGNSFKTGST